METYGGMAVLLFEFLISVRDRTKRSDSRLGHVTLEEYPGTLIAYSRYEQSRERGICSFRHQTHFVHPTFSNSAETQRNHKMLRNAADVTLALSGRSSIPSTSPNLLVLTTQA